MTKDEALKLGLQVIEAAEYLANNPAIFGEYVQEKRALKRALIQRSKISFEEALAQPEQEPHGWYIDGYGAVIGTEEPKSVRVGEWLPWYTTPPQRKPLTDEQKQAMRLYKAVERLSLQAGEDTEESVDWLCGEHGGMFKLYEAYFSPKKLDGTCPTCESLSRAVMADHVFHDKLTKPLTDEQLIAAYESEQQGRFGDHIRSLRAIEAAHGIKGE